MMDTGLNTLIDRFRSLSGPLEPEATEMEPELRKLEGIRFVVFDFYGTLFISGVGDIGIDEEFLNMKRIRQALSACNLPDDDGTVERTAEIYEATLETSRGRLVSEGFETPEPDIRDVWLDVFQTLKHEGFMSSEPDTALARLFAVEYEARSNPVWPMPGLADTLSALHGNNIPTGIISNSQFYTPVAYEALTGQSLREAGFHPGLLHWSFEVKRKKPSREFYKGFLRKLERHFPAADPASVLFVGNDMLKDIHPASAAGMKTALFAGDQRSLKLRGENPACKELKPDLVITELVQILECI